MSGRSTLIEMLAARLGRGAQHVEAAPQLREVLASALPARASAQESAWQTSRPLFHATDADLDGPLRPTRRPGFPEPTGISFAETPQVAEQFGGAVYPHYARGELGNAEQFMARSREHMARGMNSEQASAATQREFAELGYAGVRWGTGENVIFDSGDIISALDPQVARAGALSVIPSARSAEQGASVLRDGRFMRPESDYAAAHSELPAPSLRGALSEINASRAGPHAGPSQAGRVTGASTGYLSPRETAARDVIRSRPDISNEELSAALDMDDPRAAGIIRTRVEQKTGAQASSGERVRLVDMVRDQNLRMQRGQAAEVSHMSWDENTPMTMYQFPGDALTNVRITQRSDGVREVVFSARGLKQGSASRADIESVFGDALAAMERHAATNQGGRYFFEGETPAITRLHSLLLRNANLPDGVSVRPVGDGIEVTFGRTAPDGGSLRDGPNAGSDRNALQRALRERMERE